jgi:hypothetical protein
MGGKRRGERRRFVVLMMMGVEMLGETGALAATELEMGNDREVLWLHQERCGGGWYSTNCGLRCYPVSYQSVSMIVMEVSHHSLVCFNGVLSD